ncbi:MAG: bifunctional glutamate N-acetyltransferase/amino-acid acetyltransferase ArgJ [Chloroflexi bacterium]|nr:bifunctional glutamate N-acetyltransferase/amino-acid acetyltransferase ArgJ [Chloroflexota bacterium]
MSAYREITGGVTAAQGFLAGAVSADIKGNGNEKLDVGALITTVPATVAGVFTMNTLAAAPVVVCRRRITGGSARAVIFNSGNANACTGAQGITDAERAAAHFAQRHNLPVESVLITSTGVIGVPLPMTRLLEALDRIELRPDGGKDAAIAIMTTDTHPKEVALQLSLHGRTITIGGMAKGSGMIHPNMATMLAYITTDAALTPSYAQALLRRVADRTFNMLTIDGDTSTNDSLLLFANGLADSQSLSEADEESAHFEEAITIVAERLAIMLARDGEGATKVIESHVFGAASDPDARCIARAIVQSPLVKTAIYGADPNWGRIACAVGYSGAQVNPSILDMSIEKYLLMQAGNPIPFDKQAVSEAIKASDHVHIVIHLHLGDATSRAWGCDLTEEYVHINAEYTT